FVAYAPENYQDSFFEMVPEAYSCFEQVGEDIGQRMLHAFSHVFDLGYSKVVLVGCDIPHIQCATYEAAYKMLEDFDIAIAPTYDGGCCLIGLKAPCQRIFVNDFQWGNQSVVEQTYNMANQLGLSVSMLDKYRDIDEYEDLVALWQTFNDERTVHENRPRHTLAYMHQYLYEGVAEWMHTV
ncbi:MAG: glycosyltransferase, partial [Clostridia bacterium]|nr:glycosyltransferase [Clostridia bacterium]